MGCYKGARMEMERVECIAPEGGIENWDLTFRGLV